MEDSQRVTRGAKRAQEASDDDSTLTELNSHEFDDVTIARDDPHHRVGMPKKRRRRAREDEELWSWALQEPPEGKPARGNSNQEIFYCTRCRKDCTSATAFRRHLLNQHGVNTKVGKTKVEEEVNRLAVGFKIQQERAQSSACSRTSKILRDAVNRADWLNVLVLMVVNHNLPHTIVEWPEFHLLMKLSNYTLVERGGPMKNSRYSVRELLGKTYEVHKDVIKQKLAESLSKIHFTTDVWTSPNKTHYQSITAHFVDKLGRLQKATLAMREHKDSHGADEQANEFRRVLDEYEIGEQKLGYITGW